MDLLDMVLLLLPFSTWCAALTSAAWLRHRHLERGSMTMMASFVENVRQYQCVTSASHAHYKDLRLAQSQLQKSLSKLPPADGHLVKIGIVQWRIAELEHTIGEIQQPNHGLVCDLLDGAVKWSRTIDLCQSVELRLDGDITAPVQGRHTAIPPFPLCVRPAGMASSAAPFVGRRDAGADVFEINIAGLSDPLVSGFIHSMREDDKDPRRLRAVMNDDSVSRAEPQLSSIFEPKSSNAAAIAVGSFGERTGISDGFSLSELKPSLSAFYGYMKDKAQEITVGTVTNRCTALPDVSREANSACAPVVAKLAECIDAAPATSASCAFMTAVALTDSAISRTFNNDDYVSVGDSAGAEINRNTAEGGTNIDGNKYKAEKKGGTAPFE